MHTFFQTNTAYSPQTDLGTDGVLVYVQQQTISGKTLDTIRQYEERGYAVYGMISASHDYGCVYTNGLFDGRRHEDEVQRDEYGDPLMIGLNTYYMVPTDGWGDYLFQFCRNAVDAGLRGIVLEEPEYWFRAGFSSAFREAYDRRFPDEDHGGRLSEYHAGLLKAELYYNCLQKVARRTKAYAAEKTVDFRIYIAEHSLVNYATWHITCPTAAFANIPEIDGIIGQVWTGTARSPKTCDGLIREFIFETAFLEYSFFDQLALSSDKEVFLLADPVEDAVDFNTVYTWADYRTWYLDTLTAQLMQRHVSQYEVMPWPHRVFCEPLKSGRYDQIRWQELYALCRKACRDMAAGQEAAIAAYERLLETHYGRKVTFGDYSVDLLRRFKAEAEGSWEPAAIAELEKTLLQMTAFAWKDGPSIPSSYVDLLRLMQGVQQRLQESPTGEVLKARGRVLVLTGDSAMYRLETSRDQIFTQNIPTVKDRDNLFFSITLPLLRSGYLVDVAAEEALQAQTPHIEIPDLWIIGLDNFHFRPEIVEPVLKTYLEQGGRLLLAGRADSIERLKNTAAYLFGPHTQVVLSTASEAAAYPEDNPFVAAANALCPANADGISLVVKRGPYIVGRHFKGRLELPGRYLDLLSDVPTVRAPFVQVEEGNLLLKQIESGGSRFIEASAGVNLKRETPEVLQLSAKGPIGMRSFVYISVEASETVRFEGTVRNVARVEDSTGTVIRYVWDNRTEEDLIQLFFD